VLLSAVVFALKDPQPIPTLEFPVVVFSKATAPTATFVMAVVANLRLLSPTAVLSDPVVSVVPESNPIKTF
jgi:hypothetical protein